MREQAKELVAKCADLQQRVLEKFATAVLEELADQINVRDDKIKRLEKTLGTFIAWSQMQLGEAAMKELLDMLERTDGDKQP